MGTGAIQPPFSARLSKLRRVLKQTDVPALLVTKRVNVTYLTGFTGEDSYLLVTPTDQVILSDFRFAAQLEEECGGFDIDIRRPGVSMMESTADLIGRSGIKRLGVEGESISFALFRRMEKALARVEWVSTSGTVEKLRQIKDRSEIELIRRSVYIAQKAFEVVRAQLRLDQTEKRVAAELEYQIRLFGGEGCSFPPIVAVGPRAALPHAEPTYQRMEQSDSVLIDWGARVGGYASDLTRILVTGRIPAKLERIYGIVLTAQQRAIEAIRPGAQISDVDRAARDLIAKAGFGKKFGHGLGHGIGLEIHEAPRLAMQEDQPLAAGMVVTVEPGIYVPGWGGVRIEDDVLVTRDGHEVLSDIPTALDYCVVR